MLPSWRNRIYIAISSERISLLKLGRGLKSKLLDKHDEAIMSAGKLLPWQAELDRLTQLLDLPEWQNAEVHIVLSNRLARFATISFNAQLKSYSAQEAFARHSLVQIYGTVANLWDLRIQHGKTGTPSLVSAVDRVLLEGLRKVCAAHRLELNSVSPYLMQVFNHYCKAFKSDPAWLVISEPGYSLLALISGGEFVTINGVCHDSINELPILLDRENLAGPFLEPCKTVYVHASSGEKLSSLLEFGYEFSTLDIVIPDDFPSATDGLYAMAMSGVV